MRNCYENQIVRFLLTFFSLFVFYQSGAQVVIRPAKDNFTSFTPANYYSNLEKLKVLNPSNYQNNPDFGKCYAINSNWYERLDKRTLKSRSYTNDSGKVITQYGYDNINYIDQNGWMRAVDTRLKPTQNGWAVLQQENPTYLYADASTALSLGNGQFITFNKNVQFNSTPIATSNFTVGDNGMLIRNVAANTDKIIRFRRNTVETDYLLKQPLKLSGDLVISEDILLPVGYSIVKEEDGSLIVLGPDNNVKAVLKVPACYDKRKSETPGSYYLQKQAGGFRLDVIVPATWLNNPDRRYPVTIDPVVTGTTTQWSGAKIASCVFPGFGTGIMTINIPADITITGFYIQTSYYANPLDSETLNEGLVYFSTPCGTTGLTSISAPKGDSSGVGMLPLTDFHSSLSCCMLPSCSPQTVNLTMNLSRTMGGSNCDSQYIYYDPANTGGSDFEAYVVGNTVELNNSNWVLSPTTLCSNDCSLTLITTINYGVPPYTITHPWTSTSATTGKYDTTFCSSTGTDTLTLTIPNCPSHACTTSLLSVPPPVITDACGTVVKGLTYKFVTVKPAPQVVITPDSAQFCSGSSFDVSLASCVNGTTYTWTGSDGTSGTSSPIIDSIVNNGSTAKTVTYTIVPSANGCTGDSVTVPVTINPLPTSTFSVSPAKLCANGNITVTYKGTADSDAIYSWNFGSAKVISGKGEGPYIIVDSLAGTDTISLSVVAKGCSSPITTMVINIKPDPIISVAPNTVTICQGKSTMLTAAGTLKYTWTPSTSLSATTGSSINASPASTTVYSVTGIDSNGCKTTLPDTVNVIAKPLILLKAVPSKICHDSSTLIIASGASNYSWFPSTGLSATTGDSVIANPTVTTVYSVASENINGCIDTATITIALIPKPIISVTQANPKLCFGFKTKLTASGISSYLWSPSTGLSDTTGDTTIANPTITTTYIISGKDNNGCYSSDTFVLKVDSNPKAIVTPNPAIICDGTPKTLTASGAAYYFWSPSSGLNKTSGSSVIVNTVFANTYTVIAVDTNGCKDTLQVKTSIASLPHITAIPDSIKVCAGDSVLLKARGGSTYVWSPSVGLTSTTGSSTYAIPYTDTKYLVNGTDTNGCVDTASVAISIIPGPKITVTPGSPELCKGSSLALLVSGALTYTWVPSSTLSCTSCSNPIVDPTITSIYIVKSTNTICPGYDTVMVKVDTMPTLYVVRDTLLCHEQSVQLAASTSSDSIKWSPSTGLSCANCINPVISTDSTITYTVTASNGVCSVTDSVTAIIDSFNLLIGPDQHILFGQTAQLSSFGAYTYSWSPAGSLNNSNDMNPIANPTTTTTYTLTGTDKAGCSKTVTVVIYVSDPCENVKVPSGFTPEDAEMNNHLHILSDGGITIQTFKIFNRWGQMVYQTNDINAPGWDGTFNGKPQPTGTYVYYAEVNCGNRTVYLRGDVTLIR